MPSAPLLNGIDQLLRPYGGSGEYRYSQRETQSLQTGEPENWDHFFQAVRERLKIGSLFKNAITVGSFGLAGDFLSLVGWRISRGQGRALSFLLPVLTEEIGTGALTTFNREGGWSWENLKTEWLEGGIHRAILQTSTLFFFGIANPTPLSIFKKPLKTGGKTWGIAVGRFLAMGALLMLGGMAARFTSHKINNRTPNPFSEDRTVQGIFLEYLDTAWMVGQGRTRTQGFGHGDSNAGQGMGNSKGVRTISRSDSTGCRT
ncbi:MAG: hypothetical protein HYW02_03675 [Deltaproteobacteria bacterium]|nr:hypothetical protein [Deltaproteobacteria bacterium]